ncbi:MAG: hypothetical protein WAZ18_06875 [Alphaproteobacteria bacterium]
MKSPQREVTPFQTLISALNIIEEEVDALDEELGNFNPHHAKRQRSLRDNYSPAEEAHAVHLSLSRQLWSLLTTGSSLVGILTQFGKKPSSQLGDQIYDIAKSMDRILPSVTLLDYNNRNLRDALKNLQNSCNTISQCERNPVQSGKDEQDIKSR